MSHATETELSPQAQKKAVARQVHDLIAAILIEAHAQSQKHCAAPQWAGHADLCCYRRQLVETLALLRGIDPEQIDLEDLL